MPADRGDARARAATTITGAWISRTIADGGADEQRPREARVLAHRRAVPAQPQPVRRGRRRSRSSRHQVPASAPITSAQTPEPGERQRDRGDERHHGVDALQQPLAHEVHPPVVHPERHLQRQRRASPARASGPARRSPARRRARRRAASRRGSPPRSTAPSRHWIVNATSKARFWSASSCWMNLSSTPTPPSSSSVMSAATSMPQTPYSVVVSSPATAMPLHEVERVGGDQEQAVHDRPARSPDAQVCRSFLHRRRHAEIVGRDPGGRDTSPMAAPVAFSWPARAWTDTTGASSPSRGSASRRCATIRSSISSSSRAAGPTATASARCPRSGATRSPPALSAACGGGVGCTSSSSPSRSAFSPRCCGAAGRHLLQRVVHRRRARPAAAAQPAAVRARAVERIDGGGGLRPLRPGSSTHGAGARVRAGARGRPQPAHPAAGGLRAAGGGPHPEHRGAPLTASAPRTAGRAAAS